MSCPNSNNCRPVRRCCTYTGAALSFLILVLVFAIGLILGAVFFPFILPVLAAIIAFAATILVIIIALLIYWRINRYN